MAQPHISIKVTHEMKERIEKAAHDRDVPVTAVVVDALTALLYREEEIDRIEWLHRKLEADIGRKIDGIGQQIAGLLEQIEVQS